jgi:hypothetical protein
MRIRKFNESSNTLDVEYIRQCFADFIDAGARTNVDGNFIEMSIELPTQFGLSMRAGEYESISDEKNKLESFIDGQEKNNEFFQEIRNCMARLSDEYPDYRMNAQIGPINIHIMILLDNSGTKRRYATNLFIEKKRIS